MILYHCSSHVIKKPMKNLGKTYNDYGQGFYCTEDVQLAREWAVTEGEDGFVNEYEMDTTGLSILNLSQDGYNILHWLTLLIKYRRFRQSTPMMKRGADWLQENFTIPLNQYDAIVGYRADDSYFSFARAFMGNEISLSQLKYAMKLGKLGEQFVLKSARAFDTIHFLSAEPVDYTVYYPLRKARDEAARAAYRAELEKEDPDGLYIRDLIRGEVTANDSRLQ